MAQKYQDMFTDQNTEYVLKVTVADNPQDNAYSVGTLRELAQEWGIVKALITNSDGTEDESMLYEPIKMNLVIGLAQYKLYPREG